MAERQRANGTVWTIGHWACPSSVVLHTLDSAGIDLLADVRAMPGSRRSPQFDAATLPSWLEPAGIDYLHLPELGGRRPKQQGIDPSRNAAWRNASFRNYADYTLTPEFEAGLDRLTGMATDRHVAIMCGEPMPWQCHRLLIANTLTARGWTVVHLMNNAKPQQHRLGQWGAPPSVTETGIVTYPDEQEETT